MKIDMAAMDEDSLAYLVSLRRECASYRRQRNEARLEVEALRAELALLQ